MKIFKTILSFVIVTVFVTFTLLCGFGLLLYTIDNIGNSLLKLILAIAIYIGMMISIAYIGFIYDKLRK